MHVFVPFTVSLIPALSKIDHDFLYVSKCFKDIFCDKQLLNSHQKSASKVTAILN